MVGGIVKQGAESDRPQWMKAAERELADEHEIHVGNDISDVYRKHYSAEPARVRELREAAQALLSDAYAYTEWPEAVRLRKALKAWEK